MTVVHYSTTGANSLSRQWCYSFKPVYWPSVDAEITVGLPSPNQTPSVCPSTRSKHVFEGGKAVKLVRQSIIMTRVILGDVQM